MSNVQLGYTQVIDPISFKSIPSGKIYIGEYGTLPNPANAVTWKQAYFVNSDGTRTAASQPIRTNSAGYAVDGSGNIKTVQVDGLYSILVQDQFGATKFTITYPDTGDGTVVEFETILDFTSAPDGSSIYFKGRDSVGDGGGGNFYYSASSTQTADGGTVFSPPSGVGRLFRNGWTQFGFNGDASVIWFGADPSGVADSYNAITSALQYHDRIMVPAGEYRSDTMINMENSKTLYMLSGSTIVRKAAAVSTDPVIWFNGSYSNIIGEGNDTFIRSEKNSPNGVVRFGAQNMSTAQTTHSNYNKLIGAYVSGANPQGSAANTDRVIAMYGPQLGGYTCYFNTVDNCTVANGSVGIDMVGWANACHITNIHFYRAGYDLSAGALMLRGCLEAMVVGCFHHSSANAASIIVDSYDNTGTPGGVLHTAQFNKVLAFNCEQGGASAKSLRHIAGNYGTYDIGSNVAGGNEFVSYGNFNSFIINGAIITYQFEARDKYFGNQFKFPAVQVASSDVNTLDDYEEGDAAWTPSFSGATNCSGISVIRKEYTKIGRQVTIHIKGTLTVTAATTLTSFIFTLPISQGDVNNPSFGSAGLNFTGVGGIGDSTSANGTDVFVYFPANQVLATGNNSFSISYTYNAAT